MDNADLKCCLCNQIFNLASQPRMMPYCQHSACTLCIKKNINHKTNDFLKCQHCGHQENLEEVDLEYFPKNISLTKLIKEMSQSNQSKLQSKSSKDLESSASEEPKAEVCKIHNKQLEIICITDKEKLCPHCALFGKHKDHNFKTLTEANSQMQQMKKYFEGCRKKKQAIDQKVTSKQFKDNLINKIGKEKDRLITEIKQKFTNLFQNIRLAEKQAFQDVLKHFKTIYSKIVALMKQENDSQLKYKEWEHRCAQLFVQANKLKTIEEKSFIYFGGPMNVCKEGQSHLKKIQSKLDNNMITIQKLITSIKVIENVSAANSLFNYINIIVEQEDIQMITQVSHQVIELKQMKEQIYKPKMLEVSSPQQYFSPSKIGILSQITPKKRRSSSRDKNVNKTHDRRNQAKSPATQNEKLTIEKMVEQFCERENLDTLDLTGYNLLDGEILDVLKYLKPIKRIKGLKLVKNRLTNQGLTKIIEMIPTVTNLNLSFNQLGDEALSFILSVKQKIPMLRIINISNNKINERKVKSTLQQLKRQGIIVTI